MTEHPSTIHYFTAARRHRQKVLGVAKQDCGELERKVASCFVVAQDTAVYLAIAAVTNGVASIERYLPSMHEALSHLQQFHLSLIIAPCYGAYMWPNAELRAFANCLADIGIGMKYQHEIDGNGKNVTYRQISAAGVALLQSVNKMRELASSAYFFGEDLTKTFVLGWRLLKHSEQVFDELLTEALSAKALKGYAPRTDNLVGLMSEYEQLRN